MATSSRALRLYSSKILTASQIVCYGFEPYLREYLEEARRAAVFHRVIYGLEFRPATSANVARAAEDVVMAQHGPTIEPGVNVIHVQLVEDGEVWRIICQIMQQNILISPEGSYLKVDSRGQDHQLHASLESNGPDARLTLQYRPFQKPGLVAA